MTTEPAPVETISVTGSPRGSSEPGPGSWPITVPSGSSPSRVSTSGIRPWRRSVDSATSCDEPVKSSSVTRFSPLETTIVTTASHSTSAPAMGSSR